MPATSRKQFRYMKGIESGSIAPPKGLTRAKAAEYTSGQSQANLPERATDRVAKRMKGKKKK